MIKPVNQKRNIEKTYMIQSTQNVTKVSYINENHQYVRKRAAKSENMAHKRTKM